jgi:hypothetical protein
MQYYQIKIGQAGFIVVVQDKTVVWASKTLSWMVGKTKLELTPWILNNNGTVMEIKEPK